MSKKKEIFITFLDLKLIIILLKTKKMKKNVMKIKKSFMVHLTHFKWTSFLISTKREEQDVEDPSPF